MGPKKGLTAALDTRMSKPPHLDPRVHLEDFMATFSLWTPEELPCHWTCPHGTPGDGAGSREQRAESREQRAESREQRAESREQGAETIPELIVESVLPWTSWYSGLKARS